MPLQDLFERTAVRMVSLCLLPEGDSCGSCDRKLTLAISCGLASIRRYSSVQRFSDATLAAASKADAGIDAPPFCPIPKRVLIALVEGVGGASEKLDAVRHIVRQSGARQPV